MHTDYPILQLLPLLMFSFSLHMPVYVHFELASSYYAANSPITYLLKACTYSDACILWSDHRTRNNTTGVITAAHPAAREASNRSEKTESSLTVEVFCELCPIASGWHASPNTSRIQSRREAHFRSMIHAKTRVGVRLISGLLLIGSLLMVWASIGVTEWWRFLISF